jgi:hypothetical protein
MGVYRHLASSAIVFLQRGQNALTGSVLSTKPASAADALP